MLPSSHCISAPPISFNVLGFLILLKCGIFHLLMLSAVNKGSSQDLIHSIVNLSFGYNLLIKNILNRASTYSERQSPSIALAKSF